MNTVDRPARAKLESKTVWGGKTTIANLLGGLYQSHAGTIRIDREPFNTESSMSVHAAVRTVSVDGTLFRASMRDNTRYGHFQATSDQ